MGGLSRGRWLVALLLVAACGDDSAEAPADTGSIFDFDTRPAADTGTSDTALDTIADTPADGSDSGSGEEGSNDLPGGSACTRSADCIGGLCIINERFPDGYCTLSDCNTVNQCERSELCAAIGEDYLCAEQCVANADCPENFRCEFVAGPTRAACLPLPPVVRKEDGEPCTTADECIGGTCLADPDFPSGYCTTANCRAEFDCARLESDNRCFAVEGENRCYRTCNSAASPCRAGYTCTPSAGGSAYCAPTSIDIPEPEPADPSPFPTVCLSGSSAAMELSFDVAAGSSSFLATAFSSSGTIDLRTLVTPSGRLVDLDGEGSLLTVGEAFFRQVVPLYLPQYPAVESLVEEGTYTLGLTSSSRQACVRLLDTPGTGRTLNLRVYLVGLSGVTPQTAPTDPNLNAMFAEVSSIFSAAGLALGGITFHTLSERDDASYAIVRSFGEIQRMVKLATAPAVDEQQRSINIFLNRGFAFASGPVLGISAGIPGAAGLYGSEASGLAFTVEYLGTSVDGRQGAVDGNAYTGLVMAHEIGHYLGLFHVIETSGGEDPLDDTPNCRSYDTSCAASLNLMHPFAWGDNIALSPLQSRVLQLHPIMTAP
jgi:hypothetical protein